MTKKDKNGNDLSVGDIVVIFNEFFYHVINLYPSEDENCIEVQNLFVDEKEEIYSSWSERLDEKVYKTGKTYLETILNNLEKAYEMSQTGDRSTSNSPMVADLSDTEKLESVLRPIVEKIISEQKRPGGMISGYQRGDH